MATKREENAAFKKLCKEVIGDYKTLTARYIENDGEALPIEYRAYCNKPVPVSGGDSIDPTEAVNLLIRAIEEVTNDSTTT